MRPLLLGVLLLLGIACTTAPGDAGSEDWRDSPTPFPTSAMATPSPLEQLYDVARAEIIASSPDVKANTLRVIALEEQVGRPGFLWSWAMVSQSEVAPSRGLTLYGALAIVYTPPQR